MDHSAQPSSVWPDQRTLAAFAGVAVIGGGNAIAVEQSVAELAPLWSAGLRFAVAGLLLVAFVIGVNVGAFLKVRQRRSSATSLPECLPIDARAEPAPQPPTLAPRPSTGTAR